MTAQIKRSYPRCEQLCQQGRVNCDCLHTANSDGSSRDESRDAVEIVIYGVLFMLAAVGVISIVFSIISFARSI